MSDTTFHRIAKVGEIPEGQGRYFEVEGRPIAVFLDKGEYFAIDDTCPHQGAPLSDGVVFEKTVTCTWHGWRFCLRSGDWLDSKKSKTRVRTYPVQIVGDEIQVAVPPA